MANQLQAGQTKIEEITLVSSSQEEYSLLNAIKEIELIEDINKQFMFGVLKVSEPNNFVEAIPIVGEEFIRIKYSMVNDIEAPSRNLEFRVSRISNLYKPKDKQFDYDLQIISPEYFNALQVSVDTAMTDRVEKMVENIVKDKFASKKKIKIEPTRSIQNIIFPSGSASDSIKQCTFRAQSRDAFDSNYKFFETPDGWSFMSVGYMNSTDPVVDVEYNQVGIEKIGQPSVAAFSAYEYTVTSKNDTAYSLYNGGYRNSILCFDPLTKKYIYREKNYFDNDEKLAQTESNKTNTKQFENVVANEGSLEYAFITNLRNKPRETSVDPTDIYPAAYEDYYLDRQMSRVKMNDTVVSLSMPATTRIVAGQTINFNVPKDNSTKQASENDRYLSGKYLVIKVRHNIGLERGVTQLELRKAGFKNKIEKGV